GPDQPQLRQPLGIDPEDAREEQRRERLRGERVSGLPSDLGLRRSREVSAARAKVLEEWNDRDRHQERARRRAEEQTPRAPRVESGTAVAQRFAGQPVRRVRSGREEDVEARFRVSSEELHADRESEDGRAPRARHEDDALREEEEERQEDRDVSLRMPEPDDQE